MKISVLKKTIVSGVCLLMLMSMFAGCAKKEDKGIGLGNLVAKDNEILLIDRYSQSGVRYNEKEKSTVDIYQAESYFISSFKDSCAYFVGGDSEKYNFQLFKNTGKEITAIYDAPSEAQLEPLCVSGDEIFLSQTEFKGDQYVGSKVVCVDEDGEDKKELLNGEEEVVSAVVCDGFLYYSVYDSDAEKYKVCKLDYDEDNAKPEEVSKQTDAEVYLIKDVVYGADNGKIKPVQGKGLEYAYRDGVAIVDGKYMVVCDVNKASELQAEVTDIETNKKVEDVKFPVAYGYDDDELSVYTDGEIKTFKLK